MPDPKREETGPESQNNAKYEEQDFGFGGPGRASRAASTDPGWLGLRHPVQSAKCRVQCSNGQPRTENAGAEEHAEISLGALLIPFRDTQLALLVLTFLQVKGDHHGQAKSHSQPPGQTDTQQAGGVGRRCVKRMGYGPVAVQTHGCKSKDGCVHSKEIEAQK